jgi:hypothetical protein
VNQPKSLMSYRLFIVTISLFTLFSCSDKTEEFVTEPLSDYLPLEPGKYITYRVDSLVFTNFQRDEEIHSYQVKHVVDAEIKDNLGRTSYRIYRFLKNAAGTDANWISNGTYFITPLADQVEVVENNLRFIKLHAPVKEGTSWKGNKYLGTDPYFSFGYNFGNDDNMKNWDYRYDLFEPTFTYNGENYTDVFTVEQEDAVKNVPITDPAFIAFKTRSVDKYAKNIGLIYRQHELWEYQPNTTGPDPYYIGFGVTMWMIDHN